MPRRSAIRVSIDDDGKLTADLGALPADARKRAASVVEEALREVVRGGEGGGSEADGDLSEAEWTEAWDDEIGRRVKELEEGQVEPVPLDDALRRIRSAARGTR